MTASAILDIFEPLTDTVPIGGDQPALFIDWLIDSSLGNNDAIPLVFVDGIGNPPVSLTFTDVDGVSLTPTTIGGTLLILDGSPGGPEFLRGDTNQDGAVTIGDPIFLLSYLFDSGALSCEDSGDTNDDGALDVADVIYILQYLFAAQAPPPPPFPDPGADPTMDSLGCS